jgi:hypothetical protein
MKNRCGYIIFAFQGRLKSAYTVLDTRTHARERKRENERARERERGRERGARARICVPSTSTYIHSALLHQHTTNLLSIPGEVEERLHGPAHSHLSDTHAHAERGRERGKEAGRKRERGREEEREREEERSGSTCIHSFSTLATKHSSTYPPTLSILRIARQDCQSICAVLRHCKARAEMAHAREKLGGGLTIRTGKSCPWPAKTPLLSNKFPDFRLGPPTNAPVAQDILSAAPSRRDQRECKVVHHSPSVSRQQSGTPSVLSNEIERTTTRQRVAQKVCVYASKSRDPQEYRGSTPVASELSRSYCQT